MLAAGGRPLTLNLVAQNVGIDGLQSSTSEDSVGGSQHSREEARAATGMEGSCLQEAQLQHAGRAFGSRKVWVLGVVLRFQRLFRAFGPLGRQLSLNLWGYR